MELKDTIGMMVSDDYRERFKAEFKRVFERQARAMEEYLEQLKERAEIEKLKLRLDKLNKV